MSHTPPIDLTESFLAPSTSFVHRVGELLAATAWHRYPAAELAAVTEALAATWQVAADRVVLTPGADTAVEVTFRAAAMAGQTVHHPQPAYPGYGRAARRNAGPQRTFPLDEHGEVPTVADGRLIWGWPHNPIGPDVLPHPDALPHTTLDATYRHPLRPSLGPLLGSGCDVVLSFSKRAALAGVRLGAVIARDADRAAVLRGLLTSFPLDVCQLATARAVLEPAGRAEIDRIAAAQDRAADAVAATARAGGHQVVYRTAGFVTVRTDGDHHADALTARLWSRGGRAKSYASCALVRIAADPANVTALAERDADTGPPTGRETSVPSPRTAQTDRAALTVRRAPTVR